MSKLVQTCIRCGADSFEGTIFSEKHSKMIRDFPKPLVGIEFEPVVCDFCRSGIGNGLADNLLNVYKSSKKNERQGQSI